MGRAPLHLVVDNKPGRAPKDSAGGSWVTPAEAARIDFQKLGAHSLYALAMAKLILLAPLKLIATIWRVSMATGIGFLRGLIRLALGTFGLLLLGWLAFGMLRVIFHPIFHHYLTR